MIEMFSTKWDTYRLQVSVFQNRWVGGGQKNTEPFRGREYPKQQIDCNTENLISAYKLHHQHAALSSTQCRMIHIKVVSLTPALKHRSLHQTPFSTTPHHSPARPGSHNCLISPHPSHNTGNGPKDHLPRLRPAYEHTSRAIVRHDNVARLDIAVVDAVGVDTL